jgi:hypothetical protein
MRVRVKGFQTVLGITKENAGVERNLAGEIEEQVNRFLDEHPHIAIRELRLAAHAADLPPDRGANYGLFAMLLYEEDERA